MAKIIDKLSSNLKDAFAKADEIWIAVALLNVKGLNSIIHSIKKDCKINFIGGIDLPTDPAALSKILSLKPKHKVSAFIYSNPKISYHPKVYIVRTQNQLQSFIGSANCTSGGLENNIEMTIEIVEQIVSLELLEWFRKIELCSRKTPLTTDFITAYIPKYKDRISLRKKESKAMHEFKRNEEMKLEADIKERKRLVSKLILICLLYTSDAADE